MYQHEGFPAGFIIMGNFMSKEFNVTGKSSEMYSQGFDRLYTVLVKPKYRILLMSSYFVLLPGPGDATPCSSLLPMAPLLSDFTSSIANRISTLLGEQSKFICSTNPCRIRHLSRRMIFCRSDLLNNLLSSSLLTSGTAMKTIPPSELTKMLINTVFGQGHICPNKPGDSTILKHDAALLLYPLPDLVCIGDMSCPSFVESIQSTVFCNVEPFSATRSFLSYDAVSGHCQKFSI
ncbi:DNA polymerase epsilon subunit B [Babesia sp. Xinjiang]|uniref:DNA polymerase epsilon subunit B n=1 Tax=Babesia sp. Xinjiang TaxID=462227 RepID=UPI000A240586|nr:DNA polymerase epsilon subunit B [Babesia sp. Xinjiang]ORM40652.1 DNA polymerase epsilon subunit B [Babesia sp. Xinjiang]